MPATFQASCPPSRLPIRKKLFLSTLLSSNASVIARRTTFIHTNQGDISARHGLYARSLFSEKLQYERLSGYSVKTFFLGDLPAKSTVMILNPASTIRSKNAVRFIDDSPLGRYKNVGATLFFCTTMFAYARIFPSATVSAVKDTSFETYFSLFFTPFTTTSSGSVMGL